MDPEWNDDGWEEDWIPGYQRPVQTLQDDIVPPTQHVVEEVLLSMEPASSTKEPERDWEQPWSESDEEEKGEIVEDEEVDGRDGAGYRWKAGVPRKGWTYDGLSDDLGSVCGECEMCGTPIRYEHYVVHGESGKSMTVGCVCAEKMSEEYALDNRTGVRITNSCVYEVLKSSASWKVGKHNYQFRAKKNTKFYKMIVAAFNIQGQPDVYVYPEGGIFIPNHRSAVENRKDLPHIVAIRNKIRSIYQQYIEPVKPSRRKNRY